jgi:C-terminal processing protease CtpA/Prc
MVLPTVWLDTISSIPVIQVDFYASSDETGAGGSATEFDEALAKIENAPIAIIDLRGNPGGSVDDCLRMTDALLDTGLIVYELNRRYDGTLDTTFVDTIIPRKVRDNGTTAEHRPYVFLADSGSASCSEIMLAGIQENKDWPIIGTQSYGKGIGQSLGQTVAGGLVVVTTTEFRNKRMKDYHHKGITPDIQILDPDSQMVTAVRVAQAILDTLGDGAAANSALAKTLAKQTLDRRALLRVDGLHKQIPERPNGAFRFIK